MLGLYKFEYRTTLSGLFIADKEDLDMINYFQSFIYFDEPLWGHTVEIDWYSYISLVSEDSELISNLLKTFKSNTIVGYNPYELALDLYQYSRGYDD